MCDWQTPDAELQCHILCFAMALLSQNLCYIELCVICQQMAERKADELAIMQDKFILEYQEMTGNWIQK